MAVFINKATGWQIKAQNIQPWLAGIAALLVELGSTFGFLVAGAGKPAKKKKPVITDTPTGTIIDHEPIESSVGAILALTHETGMAPVEGIQRQSDGRLRVSQRKLADAMGEGRRAIAQKLDELATMGRIALEPTRSGTIITMLA